VRDVLTDLAPPLVLIDDMVALLDWWRQALGVKARTLPREIRAGRLVVHKRAGKYFAFGADIKSWLRAGLVRRQATNDG
jgi:hypothetical protein